MIVGIFGLLLFLACLMMLAYSAIRRRKKRWWGFGIILGLVLFFVGIAMSSSAPTNYISTVAPATKTYPEVVYEITGSADEVSVTLNNSTGGTEQHDHVILPAKYIYDSFPDKFLYVSAQNQGKYGSVTTNIYVNGNLYKTSTSSGAYVIASASGSK